MIVDTDGLRRELGLVGAGVDDGGLGSWRQWVVAMFPAMASAPFAWFLERLWEWAWKLRPGLPHPDEQAAVGVVFRGGAKSSTAEMIVAALGATGRRRYVLYVSGTQDQADDHVANIATLLESEAIGRRYEKAGRPLVGKHGNSRGWRVNRLRTASGFTVDAVGLDTAARGVRLDDQRPDLIVVDDIDHEHDTARAVERKIRTLTHGLLPAGSSDVVVLAVQNLLHDDSVFAQLVDGRADFLADRLMVGPVPAVVDLEWSEEDGRYVITGGEPSWAGYTLDDAQRAIDRDGLTAFLVERQHELEPPSGGMYGHIVWERCDPEDVPWGELLRSVVWVDPAVTTTDRSDSQAIQADALHADGRIFRLRSWEARATPVQAIEKAIRWALDVGADAVGVETDQGGDTWRSVYKEAAERILAERDPDLPAEIELGEDVDGVALVVRPDGSAAGIPAFRYEKAGAGHGPKAHRSSLMLADYERPGRIVHVRGSHLVLERGLRRFGLVKPFDLADAAFWAWRDLRRGRAVHTGTGRRAAGVIVPTGVR